MAVPQHECKLADLSDDVVNLKGLVHDGKPFRAGGGAPFTILRQRQLQGIENRNDFFSRSHVREVWPRTECFLVQIIKRGQPSREKLTINNTFSKAFDASKTHSL